MCWTVLYVYAEPGHFCTFKKSLLARKISAKDSISLTIFSCRLVVMNMYSCTTHNMLVRLGVYVLG